MNNQRGIFVVGGCVALLASAIALTLWTRKSKAANLALSEEMVEKYEEYVHAAPTPKRKTRRTPARNGKVVRAAKA